MNFGENKEYSYSVRWGQTEFEEDEIEKANYHGVLRRSPINDKKEIYFSSCKRGIRIFISILITLMFIACVIATVYGVFKLRTYLYNHWKNYWYADYSITVASAINAIIILIFDYLYLFLAFYMTDFENFKTQTEWEKSFVIKVFVFQFVNNFNSLFYIAFMKRDIEGCLDYNQAGKLTLSKDYKCFNEIYAQLRSIFVVAILKNIFEIGLPFALEFWSKWRKTKFYSKLEESKEDKNKLLLRIEKNLDKSIYGYEDIDGTFDDYQEILTQMGYVLLFGLAFPLCMVLAFINNVVEHQVDRAKILYFSRRPPPLGAENIGSWGTLYYILMIVGVFCYSGILCITAETFSSNRGEIFIQFVWCTIIFLMVKWSISYIIQGLPETQKIVLDRHKFIVNKYLVDNLVKTHHSILASNNKNNTNLAVYSTTENNLTNKNDCDVSEEYKEERIDPIKIKIKTLESIGSTTPVNILRDYNKSHQAQLSKKTRNLKKYKKLTMADVNELQIKHFEKTLDSNDRNVFWTSEGAEESKEKNELDFDSQEIYIHSQDNN